MRKIHREPATSLRIIPREAAPSNPTKLCAENKFAIVRRLGWLLESDFDLTECKKEDFARNENAKTHCHCLDSKDLRNRFSDQNDSENSVN